MRILRVLVTAAAMLPVAAGAGQPIELEPEQAVVLRIGESDAGDATVVSRGRAEWTPYDVVVARDFAGQAPPDEPLPYADPLPSGSGIPAPSPVEPAAVRLRLIAVAGRHAMLVVENGYDRALAYRAQLTQDGRTRATDVCLVRPELRSYEYWPHRIDRLVLSDFRFVPWTKGQPVTCE